MVMTMKKTTTCTAICLLLSIGLVLSLVSATPYASKGNQGNKGSTNSSDQGSLLDKLTEEQREALQMLIQKLKDARATPERIIEAVMQFFREQGIDVDPVQLRQFFREQGIDGDQIEDKGPVQRMLNRGPLAHQLTEEQWEELLQLIEELKDSHATPERIRNAVMQFLRQQGINIDPVQLRQFFREQGIDVQVPQ